KAYSDTKEGRPAGNSVYVAIAGEVVNRRSVILRNIVLNGKVSASNPLLHIHAKRWEKSPFGTIFPNDRPAPPPVGKPSLHSHDAFPTAAFDAFRCGAFGSSPKRRQSRAVISGNLNRRPTIWKKKDQLTERENQVDTQTSVLKKMVPLLK